MNKPMTTHADALEQFKRCLPQLIDPDGPLGDLTDKWVIWEDGWVYGLAAYDDQQTARQWAAHMGVRNDHVFRVTTDHVHPLELLFAAGEDNDAADHEENSCAD